MEEDAPKEFRELVLEDEWKKVIEKYNEDINYHKIEIKGRGTALHVAISNGRTDVVKFLVDAIEVHGDESSLKILSDIGATPLHLAAYRGFTEMCEVIIGKEGQRKSLVQEKNANGETPLFWAVCGRKRLVYIYLQQFYPLDLNIAIDKNNTSILHVAIQKEMFDLAIIIMYGYQGLRFMKNKDDVVPLEILATKTSAFKSQSSLSWWKKILYYCLIISCHDAKTTMELYRKKVISTENAEDEKCDNSEVAIPIYHVEELEKAYKIRNKYLAFKWHIPSLLDLEAIKTIKKKHIYGGQLLKEFMKTPTWSYMGGGEEPSHDTKYDDEMKNEILNFPEIIKHAQEGGDASIKETKENKKMEDLANINGKDTIFSAKPKNGIYVELKNIKTEVKDTAYLIAATHGIVEMMSELQSNIRSAVDETNSNNENALLLAVKYRQPLVIEFLRKSIPGGVFRHLNIQIDKNENPILHLAAYTSFQTYTSFKSEKTWRISGAAMQLTWEIKWYKYIKEQVPENFNNRVNIEGNIPSEIFKEQHKELLQNSVKWLNDTANSCSVVATLIAGVSFATSGSVPGGNKQTGEPALEGQPAFKGFAISSLIGLYFSVTALIMFLTILTSQKELEEFRFNLPMKLLLGLSSLFVSVVSMFVSFCAGHFFVLTDEYTKGSILFYLYISICLPVTFYASAQFPLFVDLVKVVWKKVPPQSVKGVLL
ncbi:uncharacterized protein LOC131599806 [Vicia villosa]|uniref:uncharacterized protein LOC131599806 n=1 Tax=Vicia villosa TaxID=3911 RepID=UPI00273B2BCA|nr:uncharacterized protein LOC131599806 [Vicia villosa]